MKPLDQRRFESLAGYIRSPGMFLSAKELAWYEAGNEKLLGLVSVDTNDNDYVATVLGRDALSRFRAVSLQINLATVDEATRWLEVRLAELVEEPAESFHQGDEEGGPVDFFAPVVVTDKRAEAFERLRTEKHFSPALGLIKELMHYFVDVDGNFVEQFQSAGFDARIWELYLYALFTELGYGFDRTHSAPDFHCVGPLGDFFVEATTVNSSPLPPEVNNDNEQAYFDAYVPIKFGSALFSKCKKRYWEKSHVVGLPLILAIQDFHAPGAMVWSNTGLVEYLYGIKQTEGVDTNGNATTVTQKITSHRWQEKEIPSGFFAQPGSEHISAVIANPGGTLSKFARMGFLAGFGDRELMMLRRGYAYQGGRSPTPFSTKVHESGYNETWCEGLSVYHNPRAEVPLYLGAIPCAAHHTVRDHRIVSIMPPFFPVGSQTIMLAVDENSRAKASDSGEPPAETSGGAGI